MCLDLNEVERNILVGSILGDGSLSRYGRSVNYHYREHGSVKQAGYRKWKADKLSRLGFKYYPQYKYPGIKSPSDELYTELYLMFYPSKRKKLTVENLALLTDPIGIGCLYFDDGTLVVDRYKRKNGIHLFPRIAIYSQSFTYQENCLLIEKIHEICGVWFKVKKRKDGTGTILELNKRDSVMRFIGVIEESMTEIVCMQYKLDVEARMMNAKKMYQSRYPEDNIIVDPLKSTERKYTRADEACIIENYQNGIPSRITAEALGRSLNSVYDKIRRMKHEGKIVCKG